MAQATPDNPFSLEAPRAYRAWRAGKLARYTTDPAALRVTVADPCAPRPEEMAGLREALGRANVALYQWEEAPDVPQEGLRGITGALGLHRLDRHLCAEPDGVAVLQVRPEGRPGEYIPYSDRPIRWHTDGYYNPPEEQVRAFALHCICDAAEGGANRLLDPEMVYLLLRDRDPRYVGALMHPEAMTIPENREEGRLLRPARSGPVFSVDAGGQLHLRYTARTRSIAWRDDPLTREAVACLEETLAAAEDYVIRHRLAPGEGVVTNNVLHTREGFRDDPASGKVRVLLRARFHDRAAPP
jgi:alpha-ketoglutarate-dependent taurine dioxygenase